MAITLSACAEPAQIVFPAAREQLVGRRVDWAIDARLLGEFFVNGLDEFVEVEGFFEDTASAKEFRDVEEIAFALGTGHGNDFRIEIFPRQL